MKLSKLLSVEVYEKINKSFNTHDFILASAEIIADIDASLYKGWAASSKEIYRCNDCKLLFFNWNDDAVENYLRLPEDINNINYCYIPKFYDVTIGQQQTKSYTFLSCSEYCMENILE